MLDLLANIFCTNSLNCIHIFCISTLAQREHFSNHVTACYKDRRHKIEILTVNSLICSLILSGLDEGGSRFDSLVSVADNHSSMLSMLPLNFSSSSLPVKRSFATVSTLVFNSFQRTTMICTISSMITMYSSETILENLEAVS